MASFGEAGVDLFSCCGQGGRVCKVVETELPHTANVQLNLRLFRFNYILVLGSLRTS